MAVISIHLSVEDGLLVGDMSFEAGESDSPQMQRAASILAKRLAEEILPDEITAAFTPAKSPINQESKEHDSSTTTH